MKRFPALVIALLLSFTPASFAEALKPGDHVAIIGDSITEQKLYSLYMECYFLMCKPAENMTATQFGWSGETAPGFYNRMNHAFVPFKPTVATTCYGMNDGGYSPMNPNKAKAYRDSQTAIVKRMKEAGVRFIVVGSPGGVDFDAFKRDPVMYNKTLSELRDIAKEVAAAEGVAFANVFDPMIDAQKPAKEKYGKAYHVCGGDGFHPDQNGQLIMAYAFLKGLGIDGNIGTITVDLASGKAEASAGHKVLTASGGSVEIESSRYPYCFFGDPKSPSATSGIIEFFPFNEDLNRFKLVVKSPGAPGNDKLKVTWGDASKEFTAADLAKGINLAAEFLNNPFSEPFKAVQQQVAQKQAMETPLIKNLLQNLPQYIAAAPAEKDAIERIQAALVQKDKVAREQVAASVKPVKHTIKIEAVK